MPGSCSRNMTLSASASSGGRSASPPTAGSRKAGATVSMSLSRGPRSSSSSTTSSSGKANVERRAVERSDLLIGRPPPNERGRGRGGRGNREVPPAVHQRRGLVGETWFPPRERAEVERRSFVSPRQDDRVVGLPPDRDLGVLRRKRLGILPVERDDQRHRRARRLHRHSDPRPEERGL